VIAGLFLRPLLSVFVALFFVFGALKLRNGTFLAVKSCIYKLLIHACGLLFNELV